VLFDTKTSLNINSSPTHLFQKPVCGCEDATIDFPTSLEYPSEYPKKQIFVIIVKGNAMSQEKILLEARVFFDKFERSKNRLNLIRSLLMLQEILEEPESIDMKAKAETVLKTLHRKILESGKLLLSTDYNPEAGETFNYYDSLSEFKAFLSFLPETARHDHEQMVAIVRRHPRWITDLVDSLSEAEIEELRRTLSSLI
jgi:hypothetical protein